MNTRAVAVAVAVAVQPVAPLPRSPAATPTPQSSAQAALASLLRNQVRDAEQIHPGRIARRVVAPYRAACEPNPATRPRAHDLFPAEREVVGRKGPRLAHGVENLDALGVAVATSEDGKAPSDATGGGTELAPRALPCGAIAAAPAGVGAVGAAGEYGGDAASDEDRRLLAIGTGGGGGINLADGTGQVARGPAAGPAGVVDVAKRRVAGRGEAAAEE